MPLVSVTTTGDCAFAVEPAATIVGLPVRVIESSVLDPAGPACSVQVAFVPQMMSAAVFVFPPVHAAGPLWLGFPQSLSVTRTTAFAATDIASLKSIRI